MTFSSQGCRAAANDLTKSSNTLDSLIGVVGSSISTPQFAPTKCLSI